MTMLLNNTHGLYCYKIYQERKALFISKKRLCLSCLLLKITDSLGWNEDKYNGITKKRYALIRDYYRRDNNKFAINVWNVEKWDDIFPVQAQYTTNYKIYIFDYLKVKKEASKFIHRNLIHCKNYGQLI